MKPLNTDNDNTSEYKTEDELCVDTLDTVKTCVAQSNDHSIDAQVNSPNDNLGIKDREFFESVVAVYHDSDCSIRETATQMDISRSKVRKILITMGEITSDITEKALPLLAEGKPQKEVADILGVSVATLSTYLPYGNRVFNREDKTEDAIRSKEYRIRQKSAASRQVRSGDKSGEKSGDKEEQPMQIPQSEANWTDKLNKTEDCNIKKTDFLEDQIKVLKLKLDLVMDEDDREIVRKYGKAKAGISREIIVPEFYPLHALHYAIQKAFGWQNSHLHHFEFPDDVFEKLTEGKFVKYCMLCGLLFRFPYGDADMADIYWDDDYSEGKSFKTWLKSKYTAPYSYGGTLEHFMFSQVIAKRFWDENSTVRIHPSFGEYLKGNKEAKEVKLSAATCEEMDRFFEGNLGEIIERASISNVMCSNLSDAKASGENGDNGSTGDNHDAVDNGSTGDNHDTGDNGSTGESVVDAYERCDQIADNLDKRFDADLAELKRVLSIGEKLNAAREKEERLSKRKNTSPISLFGAFSEVQELEKEYEEGLDTLLNRTNAEMPPLSNELIYKYDYGDGWEVKITCEAEYQAGIESENITAFYAADGTPVDEGLSDLIFNKCIMDGNPICIAADGLPVMDDVGGVSGYCDFLKCIKNGEESGMYDDPEDSKDWARGMGWTGRMSKPENIL